MKSFLKEIGIKNILEWSMVIYVAFYMLIYGIGKYYQFGNFEQYSQPLNSYNGMDLMWAFYAYDRAYSFIIGGFEVLGALLLVVPKIRILGSILLTSILTNIIFMV